MRPSATVTVLQPTSPDPTKKRVRITVSPAGCYLVRGWFTKSATPADATAAGPASPGDTFYAATNALGVRDIEVSESQAAYFYCNVTPMGLIASSDTPLPVSKLFMAPADGAITTAEDFATWVGALTAADIDEAPTEGTAYTVAVAPPPNVTNIVIAYPDHIRVLNSVVQAGTGMQNKLSWLNDTNSTNFTYEQRTYRVYQNVTLFPWTQPETFTITL